ncbi:CmcI family methyltransferase [Mesorhizobium sp. SARCC-RB16n]|uniref:CmcI family methyltransferase n=1 Tax=Mesorhizobium sp. SARCC-RB16n TaxID=2116687 RepID=UPI00166A5EE5|nr:CmcI family methyltransferase [Mesorhizobium sp. SARCC-RB16n]
MKLTSGYQAFWDAAHENYPDHIKPGGLLDQGWQDFLPDWPGMCDTISNVLNADHSDRFAKPSDRVWMQTLFPWSADKRATKAGALAKTYKGLILLKLPFDLALYPRLIWELQPRTILELGSYQGGSGLWFADNMSVLCDIPGEVHSFDLYTKCVHENAKKHPLLTFHQVDISDVANFDENLLARLPHPWLVVDDAHVKIFSIFSYLNRFMSSGDYYVIEDNSAVVNHEVIDGFRLIEESGFLIDTYYTDAFGINVTCAPNAWLRKS